MCFNSSNQSPPRGMKSTPLIGARQPEDQDPNSPVPNRQQRY